MTDPLTVAKEEREEFCEGIDEDVQYTASFWSIFVHVHMTMLTTERKLAVNNGSG
jgi:hypothetical protein